ncbi:MAG: UvrD-helicase domain-containing protein, partial [Bacillota bacterium]
MELLEELNSVQREAVLHDAGPALVLAGAGSGKTRVLTRRLAHLIADRGVSPFSVLAITFTNKAAREMKERCEALIGQGVRHMWIGTFHAACLRILRSNVSRVGYRPGFVIYDSGEQRAVVREAMKKLNISEKKLDPRAVLNAISRAKNRLRGPSDLESDSYPYRREVTEIYRQYQQLLQGYNAMDFDDLLARTVALLRDDPEVLSHYQEKFEHVLVDEYQDTNNVQYRLVKLLSGKHRNLFAVGDSDQSIYGWRGADINNILNFEADFPEAKIYRMEENYRSTRLILRAAQRMIQCNERRQEKDLWTRRTGGDPICLYRASSGEEEALFVVSYIEQLVREGHHRWADFGVLYRVHAQSRLLEETCIRRGVPYRMFGGQRFYDRSEVRDAIAMLRLLVNGEDWVSLRRVINRPRRGVGPATVEKLESFAAERGHDIYRTLDLVDEIPGLRGAQKRGVEDFARILGRVREEMHNCE